MSEERLRTFIAFPIGESLVQKISALQEELKRLKLDAKWVDPKKIHLTLKFLGDTPLDSLEKIKNSVEEIVKRHSPFTVSLDTFGAFPNFRSPRILWIGCPSGSLEAESLAEDLAEGLSLFGFEKEKRTFKPHLTLARLRSLKNEKKLSEFAEGYRLPWKEILSCQTLIHYKSTLAPRGAIYESLYEVHLV